MEEEKNTVANEQNKKAQGPVTKNASEMSDQELISVRKGFVNQIEKLQNQIGVINTELAERYEKTLEKDIIKKVTKEG